MLEGFIHFATAFFPYFYLFIFSPSLNLILELTHSIYLQFIIYKKLILYWQLKNEIYYDYEKSYSSFEEFSKVIEEYIDYYNNERIQSKTKWMPPTKYRLASTTIS